MLNSMNWAEIWCQLNRFDYPKEFGNEPSWWLIDGDRTRNFTDGAMKTLRLLVTPKQLARTWNKEWDDAHFDFEWGREDFRSSWEMS